MGDRHSPLHALLTKRVFGSREEAFATPLVIPVALLLILTAVTLASRTTNSYITSTKQSDSQAAREAAESGMSRVLSALNPMAKSSNEPYLSFLLASVWQPGSGLNGFGWRLTNQPQAVVQNLLRQCGLSARGIHPNSVPPSDTRLYQNLLIDGGIGPVIDNSQMRYRVVDYVPPQATLPLPAPCGNTFTTVFGGTAQITVEGRVVRRNRVVARHMLTRNLDIQGWPLLDLPVSWLNFRLFPGPPIGLRISGQGTNLSGMSTTIFRNFTTDTAVGSDLVSTENRPQCYSCVDTGLPANGVESRISPSDLFPANGADLPPFPFDTDSPPASITRSRINQAKPNYPFTTATPSTSALEPECILSETVNAQRGNEIDCWIDGIDAVVVQQASQTGSTVTLTSQNPHGFTVGSRIYVQGLSAPFASLNGGPFVVTAVPASNQVSFTTTQPAATIPGQSTTGSIAVNLAVNTQLRPVNLILLGNAGMSNPVVLKHFTAVGQPFDHTDLSLRQRWPRLRLFGIEPASTACTGTGASAQTVSVRADAANTFADSNPSSLGGTFVWLPRGTLNYGAYGGTTPSQLLSSWWVCNLDLNLAPARPLRFIMGLYGSHEAIATILPGGFIDGAGNFTPDLRFPVYPQLQRIRSAY